MWNLVFLMANESKQANKQVTLSIKKTSKTLVCIDRDFGFICYSYNIFCTFSDTSLKLKKVD